MIKITQALVLLWVVVSLQTVNAEDYQAKVDKDIETFQNYFKQRFKDVEFNAYADGVYALDAASREQWLDLEEFPPYELEVDAGEELYSTPFANGKTYADCFGDLESGGVRQNYPYYDLQRNMVITLEMAINDCRVSNGEEPLPYLKGDLARVSAYIAFNSRDETFNLKVASKGAYEAYEMGKKFFFSKRGQLNFSCADCHMKSSGNRLRADIVGPGLGHPTGFPVYRSGWDELGTLHRRYEECNRNIRAVPFAAQSEMYRNLEYFQTVVSAGLVVNGPSSRK